jgi:serine protease Do
VQEVDDEVADAMKMDRSRGGAFVNEVTNDGPAQRGGLLATDVILKFGDADITEMKILPKTVSNYPIDETARVVVWRKGREKVLRIKVEKMRNEKNKKVEKILEKQQSIKPVGQALGLSLSELKSKVKQGKGETNLEGLAITEINSKSEAADKGMAVGDIIISANQTPVKSIEDFKSAMEESAKSGKKLLLFVKRGDANYSAVLNAK